MNAAELAARLDDYFHIERYETDDFAAIVDLCREADIAIEEYATPSFLQRFNGLMLDNADEVEQAFCLVFPSDEALGEVERRAAGQPCLVFTHHPMDMETGGRGLVPVPTDWLERLRGRRICLYAAHAPLDCHETTSTSRALAGAVGVPVGGTFGRYFGGQAGVYGHIEPIHFIRFEEEVKAACGVATLETKVVRSMVERVAVVAGGAAYPRLMEEAQALGCDTYVTGDWRVRHGGAWADEHRPQFEAALKGISLNLIGGSHYATEMLVLRDKLVPYFRSLGLAAEFVPQSDPWR
ncbi:MAG: Nif3-like dinuclear metal center hexameric protein [Dehalococcoidia bacterium]